MDELTFEKYKNRFFSNFNSSEEIDIVSYRNINITENFIYYKIKYWNSHQIKYISEYFNIPYSPRFGIPRTSFFKIIYLNMHSHGIFICPGI